MYDHIVVWCAVPNQKIAHRLARLLVETKCAACVSLVEGMRSIYQWENEICDSQESMIIIKTLKCMYPNVEKTIREHHPDVVPEIVALPVVKGYQNYLQWISHSVTKPSS